MFLYIFAVLLPFSCSLCCANARSRCTDPLYIDQGSVCYSSMSLYADVTVVGYLFLPFDILFYILRHSMLYRRAECWMNTITCILYVITSLTFSMSAEYEVSQVIVDNFVILSLDIIVSSSNQIPNSF